MSLEATRRPLEPGILVAGRYRLGTVIGSGGTAVVYDAEEIGTQKLYALKVLRKPPTEPEAKNGTLVLLEAQVAVKLTSPHAVKLVQVGVLPDGRPFLVMEKLLGVDAGRRLLEHGPMSVMDACEIVLQACHALAESHRLGVVHRDLKPANLFLSARRDGSPHVKVLDFGVASLTASDLDSLDTTVSSTTTWRVAGSPGYAAPEQIGSQRTIDERADIWGLGIVLHELVLGRRPFESATLIDSLIAAGSQPLAPMGAVAPEFEAIVRRCLEKDRELRFPSITALAEALAPLAPPSLADYPDLVRQIAGNIPAGADSTQRTFVEDDGPSSLLPSRAHATLGGPKSGPGATSSSVAHVIPAEVPPWAGLVGIAFACGAALWVVLSHAHGSVAAPRTPRAAVAASASASMLLPPLNRAPSPAASAPTGPGGADTNWREVP